MEAVAEEQGPLEANKEFRLEDDTAIAVQEEEFDFDIGGPGDNLEETLAGLDSTQDGTAYHTDYEGVPHDPQHSLEDHGAGEFGGEYHEKDLLGQNQRQRCAEASAFDTLIDAAAADQADPFDDEKVGHIEDGEAEQAEDADYGNGEQYEEEVSLGAMAEEYGALVGADQENEEAAQEARAATGSAELSYVEHGRLRDDVRDDNISAEEHGGMQTGEEMQPPVDSNYVEVTAESGTTVAEPHSGEFAHNSSLEHDAHLTDAAVRQENTDAAYDLDDAGAQEVESSRSSEQHPRVRVSYGPAEFYLFAESPDADPDDYFFEDADVLSQPLSKFLSKLRQVISEDLQDLDELFVKVDGLGIEFGEATTKDFLEHTTFGQILDLYDRLVDLDDSPEAPQLYIYLETRPNCLHRLTELAKTADEGKGLSQVAFYYEGTPGFAAVEEASIGYDEDQDSDDISEVESNGQVEGSLNATEETEQPHNPFRLSQSQQKALDAQNPSLAEEEVVNDSMSADADDGNAAYEDENDESFSGDMQENLELTMAEASHDVNATEAQQDPDMLTGEGEDLAAEVANDGPEDQHYVDEDLDVGEEVTEPGTNAEVEHEDFQDDDGPTDGEHLSTFELSGCTASSEICACASCMSAQPTSFDHVGHNHAMGESEVKSRDTHRQLVEDALADVHQALVATAEWSSNFSSIINARDSVVANLDQSNRKENMPADFSNVEDYDTAENDDYLDIGATEEESAEPAEYAASLGTPEPASHNSSATATLNGEGQGHSDDVSAPEALADAGHPGQSPSQPEPGTTETQTDEIHWNDDGDDANNDGNDEFDNTSQNQTDLSPSSLSVKRGRQADVDDVGLGDDSGKPLCGANSRFSAKMAPVAKRRRT
jgi:hypothetical protein